MPLPAHKWPPTDPASGAPPAARAGDSARGSAPPSPSEDARRPAQGSPSPAGAAARASLAEPEPPPRTPDTSPGRRPPSPWDSPISNLVVRGRSSPARCPLELRPPPLPTRAPWHDLHATLAEENHRAARLMDDNMRLRLENRRLAALVDTHQLNFQRARETHAHTARLFGHQQAQLRQLEAMAAASQEQLDALLAERASTSGTDEADHELSLQCDERVEADWSAPTAARPAPRRGAA